MSYKDFHSKNDSKVIFLNKKSMRSFVMQEKQKKQVGILTGSLLSIFIVVAVMNQKIVNQNELIQAQLQSQQNRGIASVGSLANDSMHRGVQFKLLEDVRKALKEGPVLVGKKPSKKEQFLMATLGGNYLLEEENGKIKLTSLNENKHNVESVNAFALTFVENMLNAEFKEVKALQAGSFEVIKADGSKMTLDIRLDAEKRLETVEIH